MQIRYRITLAYSVIVTVILLLLCGSVYYFSSQNRTNQFYIRLQRKSVSTLNLLWTYKISPEQVRNINYTSPSALLNKAIFVYDDQFRKIFTFFDHPADSFEVSEALISRMMKEPQFFFTLGERDVVALTYTIAGKKYHIITAAYDADRTEWLPKLRLILVISFIASLSAVIVSGYIFSVRLVRPISELTGKIKRISSEEFSRRLPAGNGKDELQQLAATINDLLDRLQSSFNTQRRFIDNASHEISTPLASIGSQIDVALQRERTSQEYRNVLGSIYDDTRRLNMLVRSLLEIAKVSGSAKGIELSPIRVDELLMRLPAEMRKVNAQYDVKLAFNELPDEDDDLTVYGNEELLFSALRNIVLNGCKYSSDNKANVKLDYENSYLKIAIEDHGPGIAKEEQELIFRPFYRSAETNSMVSGSGLGLPLANQIINLYGGHIELQSQMGIGSTFFITLKTAAAYNKSQPNAATVA